MHEAEERAVLPHPLPAGAEESRKLRLICASRLGTSVATMAYPGTLPFLLSAWGMTAAEAGAVQSGFNLATAISLLLASWLADRVGAKRVFLAAIWGSALAYAFFALFARSYETALVLYALVALAQGGTYTAAIMLVADAVPPARRGRAIGRTLAASSLGYVVSIVLTTGGAKLVSYEWGLYACAAGPFLGAVSGTLALTGTPNLVHRRAQAEHRSSLRGTLGSRQSVLLTIGYTAHCWEVLGIWAWAPAFLMASLSPDGLGGTMLSGVAVAAALHLAGFAATFSMGDASDRWGRRNVLVATAAGGALLSLIFGWCGALPAPLLLALAFLYSFTALGDSSVLSAAMTEAVPPSHLGTLLALRSVLGFGAGAASPVVFGWILDATNITGGLPQNWGWAFAVLGIGGLVATLSSALLPAGRERRGYSRSNLSASRAAIGCPEVSNSP